MLVATILAWTAVTIFRCAPEGGPVEYSDRPCAGASMHVVPALIVTRTAPLTPAEERRLEAMAKAHNSADRERAKRRVAHRREKNRASAQRARNCEAALAELSRIRAIRRKGYSLERAFELDNREAEQALIRAQNCDA